MGIFAVSLIVYYFLYSVLYGSLQTGISKMVSVRNNKGVAEHSKHIVKPALAYVVITGILLMLFSGFALGGMAGKFLGMVYPVPVIQILCIVLVLTGITDVLCGYHMGNGNVFVSNIVNLLKCVLPIGFSFIVLRVFISYGSNVSALLKNSIIKDAYMAMGIASVYLISTVVVFLVVVFFTIKSR
jgi:O-antigen/teichoic acid export membrane protein